MKPFLLALAASSIVAPALAQETREMDAHVHGVSNAEIAVEGGMLEIDIVSPGADIVGFEYEATSAEDKDAVAAAIRQFLAPEEIVALPEDAGCRLTEVLAHLHSGDHEHDHHEDHANDEDHEHDEHSQDDGDDHKEHAEDDDHDDHDEGGEHADGKEHAEHSEFHVTYAFACDDGEALTTIEFPFFTQFDNAQEIEVQYVTETGAGTAELTPDAAELTFE